MYKCYTKQSLPTKQYRELLGSAVFVFNSNKYDWYHPIDLESGKLRGSIHEIITSKCSDKIENLFVKIIRQRNRIIHSYCITDTSGEQILATKEKVKDGNKQYKITEKYLLQFIKFNQKIF